MKVSLVVLLLAAAVNTFVAGQGDAVGTEENNLGNRNENRNGRNDGDRDRDNGNRNRNRNGNANARGDPMLTGFDQRHFEFLGNVDTYYNFLTEKHHKVTSLLKLGEMWDHNGTYMQGFGFQYRDQQVIMQLGPQDNMEVIMNGEPLVMTKGETELEMIPFVEAGEMVLVWQKHREGLGNAVEITTDLLQVLAWITPAGTVDEGGKEQPAYMNLDIALMGPPSDNTMQGIIGETFNRMLAADAIKLPDDYKFYGEGPESNYIIGGFFDDAENTIFGQKRKRVLFEEGEDLSQVISQMAFPLRASGRASVKSAALPLARAGGGRKGRFL